MEAYGATRKMNDSDRNEDAFALLREPALVASVADGSGRAYGVAARALTYLHRMVRHTDVHQLKFYPTWETMVRSTDAYLAGGAQTTLVTAMFLGEGIYGAQCGDSRIFEVNTHTGYAMSMSYDTKPRVGSGECVTAPIHIRMKPDCFYMMATDGAWTTIDRLSIQKAIREMQHFSDLPSLLIQQALKQNRGAAADDMTIVVVRR